MISFDGRGILLDIEGTTSSISFVFDVMFPYVRRELNAFLASNWETSEVRAACRQLADDAGWEADAVTGPAAEVRQRVQTHVEQLMDQDSKTTGLKQLQGLIWRAGFEGGEMQAHVYEDVPVALRRWQEAGRDVRIYSSGSVQAQRLFFGYTEAGDLLSLFRGHYDTKVGPKKEADSYRRIVDDFAMAPSEVLFVSDVVAELDAAAQCGLTTVLSVRPGNPNVPANHGHDVIDSFDEIP